MSGFCKVAVVLYPSLAVGVLDQQPKRIFFGSDIITRPSNQFYAQRFGTGFQHIEGLRENILIGIKYSHCRF